MIFLYPAGAQIIDEETYVDDVTSESHTIE